VVDIRYRQYFSDAFREERIRVGKVPRLAWKERNGCLNRERKG